ncbi:MAG: folylpolyglutamate synthase/dihydrofolate synthase family protein [Halioglobus sp.]
MNNATLAQWLEYLETLHPSEMELGLDRVAAVARRLQLIPVSIPVITVAGTNGKGSTSAVLEALLTEMGQVVGLSTSPHFLNFNERIRVGSADVADAEIVAAFEEIEAARQETALTYFEFSLLAALLVFRRLGVDTMILEVGLGGRLDAVNIVDASLAIITSIELDHQEWLGDSRDLIAVEKAGILRRDQTAIIAEPNPPVSLRQIVLDAGAKALFLGEDFWLEEGADGWQASFLQADAETFVTRKRAPAELLPVNICAAVQAALALGAALDDAVLDKALARVHLPGRRQTSEVAGLEYVLDVAHNPAAVSKLLEYISLSSCKGKTFAVFSVMSDKDVQAMLEPCQAYFDAWFLADQPNNPRASQASDIAQVLRKLGNPMISVSKNLRQAFRRAQLLLNPGDRLVVFGSFFTVAAVMPLLEKDSRRVEA